MIQEFSTFFQLGFEHILDLQGYDHILFLVALCALYTTKEWKKVLILVTAFTIGHSLTLALAVLDIIHVSKDWIEFLIPLTIAITAIHDLIKGGRGGHTRFKYFMALGFGLIHGLGFSNFLRALLGGGSELFLPLLSFNIGLEIGQVVFVSILLILAYLYVYQLKLKQTIWSLGLLNLSLIVALYLMYDRIGAILP